MKENTLKNLNNIIYGGFYSIISYISYILSTRPYNFTNNGKVLPYDIEQEFNYIKFKFNNDSILYVLDNYNDNFLIQALYKEENNYVMESFDVFIREQEFYYRKKILDDDYIVINDIENKNAKEIFDKISSKSSYFKLKDESYLCDKEEFLAVGKLNDKWLCHKKNSMQETEDFFGISGKINNPIKVIDDAKKEFSLAKEQDRPLYMQNKMLLK